MICIPLFRFLQLKKNKKYEKTLASKYLNATYADLPAPQWSWEEMAEAPVPRLDGAAVQLKNLLYVFAGYGTIDYVSLSRTSCLCFVIVDYIRSLFAERCCCLILSLELIYFFS